MPIATLLTVLLVLATSSTARAATKAIRLGKLVDGTGRVVTNAVVIVEDDRVQGVVSGNASIPPGAEVIDLSRYTGIPGLIDAHTHITYYWDGMTVPQAFRAGVRIVMGSDAVYNGWGLNTRELDWFVKIGMTPGQALKTATTEPAAMLGMEKSLGAVAPGFFADIVAVEGDPDITVISQRENVRWVMKAGRVVVDKTKETARTNRSSLAQNGRHAGEVSGLVVGGGFGGHNSGRRDGRHEVRPRRQIHTARKGEASVGCGQSSEAESEMSNVSSRPMIASSVE